jgi:HEAT repeat protein
MGGDAALDDVVLRALESQRIEYESDFETTNEPLQWLIDQLEPDEQLEIGRGLLASADVRNRVLGARVLREIWDRRAEALNLVVQAVQHEVDDDVLGWLLSAVAFLGDSSALGVVEGFVHHRDPRVRDQAAGAISRCGAEQGSSSALDALIELTDDPRREVRFSALFELGQWWQEGYSNSRIERCLRAALGDEDGRARDVTAQAFAAVAPPSG